MLVHLDHELDAGALLELALQLRHRLERRQGLADRADRDALVGRGGLLQAPGLCRAGHAESQNGACAERQREPARAACFLPHRPCPPMASAGTVRPMPFANFDASFHCYHARLANHKILVALPTTLLAYSNGGCQGRRRAGASWTSSSCSPATTGRSRTRSTWSRRSGRSDCATSASRTSAPGPTCCRS